MRLTVYINFSCFVITETHLPMQQPTTDDVSVFPAKAALSLKTVAEKLISHFSFSTAAFFDINEVAETLGVPKRRLYDVLNIMGPLGLVNRNGRGKYHWTGTFQPNLGQSYIKEQDTEKSHVRDLSSKFLCLIRDTEKNTITLEKICESVFEDKGQLRRLYDISAVFEVLSLIKRQPKTGDFIIMPLLRGLFVSKMLPPKKRFALIPINNHIFEGISAPKPRRMLIPSITQTPNGQLWLGATSLH